MLWGWYYDYYSHFADEETEKLVQSHTASKCQSQHLNLEAWISFRRLLCDFNGIVHGKSFLLEDLMTLGYNPNSWCEAAEVQRRRQWPSQVTQLVRTGRTHRQAAGSKSSAPSTLAPLQRRKKVPRCSGTGGRGNRWTNERYKSGGDDWESHPLRVVVCLTQWVSCPDSQTEPAFPGAQGMERPPWRCLKGNQIPRSISFAVTNGSNQAHWLLERFLFS